MIPNKITLLSMTAMLFACTPDPKTVDDDQDGFTEEQGDCDDANANINPDAAEVCDGADNNCNGETDDADAGVDTSTGSTFYEDEDGDGFGDPEVTEMACAVSEGWVEDNTDCDDVDAEINPEATEICDEWDNDCDGLTDMEDDSIDMSTATTYYEDADADLYGDVNVTMDSCDTPDGYVDNMDDCDDLDAAINPDALEVCDGLDNDCDALTDDEDDDVDLSTGVVWYEDFDMDGYGDPLVSEEACDMPAGYVDNMTDCDDVDNASTHTAIDADCDTILTDDDCNDYDATSTALSEDADCDGVLTEVDCDDADDAVGSTDDDSDGYIDCLDDCDPTDASVGPVDADGDGFVACVDDCDDTDAMTYPGAAAMEPTLCTYDADQDGYGPTVNNCYDVELYDSYGDGWNGNAFDLVVDGNVVETITLASGSEGSQTVCIEQQAEVVFTSGSFISEISAVVSQDGVEVLSIDGSSLSSNMSGMSIATVGSALDSGTDCDDNDAGVVSIDDDGDGFSACVDDCDDSDATINPNDDDGDGYADCGDFVDCDDTDPNSNNTEIDGDCDDVLTADDCDDSDAWYGNIADDADCDGDLTATDCDDSDPDVYTLIDDGGICGEDGDGDGYGSMTPSNSSATAGTDCSDLYAYYHPYVAYMEDDPSACMRDFDGDGYGSTLVSTTYNNAPGTDCDDSDDTIGATDDDMDGAIACIDDCNDSDASLNQDDVDGDGYSTCDNDCDDNDASANFDDNDGDGYATCEIPGCFTINMVDSYGDGWNGNTIDIQIGGATVESLTLSSGSSGSEQYCPPVGQDVGFSWGESSWATEVSFSIADADGDILSGAIAGSSFAGYTLTITDTETGTTTDYVSGDIFYTGQTAATPVDADDDDSAVQ